MHAVVVPLDGSELSERALLPAYATAWRAGAPVHLVAVAEGSDRGRWERYLADRGSLAEVPVTTSVRSGDVAAAVVDAAGADSLICMATRGGGGLAGLLTGGTASGVLARCECPVLLVGPSSRTTLTEGERGRLVVSVDDTPESEAVIEPAAELARTLGVEACLVEVAAPEEAVEVDGVPSSDAPTEHARRRLEALAARVLAGGAPEARTEVLYGADVPAALVQHATRSLASYLAMASHVRRGLDRLARGSITLRTVADAPCPVLVVRSPEPPGQ